MQPGRKPKPTALKLVTGNPGKRPLPPDEPKPDLSRPAPPPFLSDDAKVEWGRVIDTLFTIGLMSDLDRAVLGAYCQAYGRWAQAERQLLALQEKAKNDGALVIKTKTGNWIQNPLVGIANKAAADMVRYASEFGMSPAARARVKAGEPEQSDPAKRFFC